MNARRRRLYFPPLTVGFFVLVAVVLTAIITNAINHYQPAVKPPTEAERFEAAVSDAMLFGEADIRPLVRLNDSSMVDTNDLGQVLLITWHDTPFLYREDGEIVFDFGAVWAVTDGEFAGWYNKNSDKIAVDGWAARLEQLLGMPPNTGMTHFSGVWVWPDDVRRPAYNPNPASPGMSAGFDGPVEPEFKAWFDKTVVGSYFDGRRPWTRLGYTYDWAPGSGGEAGHYGLTEFIIEEGCSATVGFTRTTADFREWLDERWEKYKT